MLYYSESNAHVIKLTIGQPCTQFQARELRAKQYHACAVLDLAGPRGIGIGIGMQCKRPRGNAPAPAYMYMLHTMYCVLGHGHGSG